MNDFKYSAHQIGTVIFFLTRTSFTIFGYSFFFQNAKNNTSFLFLLIASICAFLFYQLLKLRKKKNILLQASIKPKKILFLFVALFFYILLSRELIHFIQKTMIDLPSFLLFVLYLYISYLLSKRRLHSIAGISQFLFFIFLLFFIVTLLGGLSLINFDFLSPLVLSNKVLFLQNSIFLFLFLMPSFIFISFLPHQAIQNQKEQEKIIFSYFILGCLSIFLEFLLIKLTLGNQLAMHYSYPLFSLISRVSSFLILNRFFFLFTFCLLFDSTISLSLLFYSILFLTKDCYLSFSNKVLHLFEASQSKYHSEDI